MSPQAKRLIGETLDSGFIGQGDIVARFEHVLADQFGKKVATVNSATSGLTVAIHMLGLPRGARVLTSPLTCVATNWAILNNGLSPLWVDVNPLTLNMDTEDLRRKAHQGDAIVAMHWGGNYMDLDTLQEIAKDYGLPVVHDLAHCWGATVGDRDLGSAISVGVYSLQAVKPLTTGDGGIVLHPDIERVKKLRWYGIDRDHRDAPVTEAGFKYHMNDLAASLGIGNLDSSFLNVKRNQENAKFYHEKLYGIDGITSLGHAKGSSCYLSTLLVERREDFIRAMKSRGVEVTNVHNRNDTYDCVSSLRSKLYALDYLESLIACIPAGWWVTDEDREYVVSSIEQGW